MQESDQNEVDLLRSQRDHIEDKLHIAQHEVTILWSALEESLLALTAEKCANDLLMECASNTICTVCKNFDTVNSALMARNQHSQRSHRHSGMNGYLNGSSNGILQTAEPPSLKTPSNSKIALIHCLRVLSVFNKLFQRNLRFRDRSVKVVQYGCQMLSGWCGGYFSPDVNEGLSILRRTASNSRKWFWLLKSVQHVFWLYHKTLSKDPLSIVEKYDYGEQIFLVRTTIKAYLTIFQRKSICIFKSVDIYICNGDFR